MGEVGGRLDATEVDPLLSHAGSQHRRLHAAGSGGHAVTLGGGSDSAVAFVQAAARPAAREWDRTNNRTNNTDEHEETR